MNKVVLLGNPNVGKTSIFNALTKSNEHTGNWTGKTVDFANKKYTYNKQIYNLIDLPGTYSLYSYSKEEEVTRDYIYFEKYDTILIVIDSTLLERNMNLVLETLEINKNAILCLNLIDLANKKGINIDTKKLEKELGIPVIKVCSNNKKDITRLKKVIEKNINKKSNPYTLQYSKEINKCIRKINKEIDNKELSKLLLQNNKNLNDIIYKKYNLDKEKIENIISNCNLYLEKKDINYNEERLILINNTSNIIANNVCNSSNYKIPLLDKIFNSKLLGIPFLLLILLIILWITIIGSNYPSSLLFNLLFKFNNYLSNFLITINTPAIIHNIIINGILKTLFWVISVMLPPMIIFFPLFAILEESGILPRIAFNTDKIFKNCNCHGKQSLTMCMGLGCNVCGVNACRIIDSKKERLIAIITNSFIPCNGRFPSLITIITMFLVTGSLVNIKVGIILALFLILSFVITLLISKLLSKTLLKGYSSSFILEMPSFKKTRLKKIIVDTFIEKIFVILKRAILITIPTGIIIWLLSNININYINILSYITNFLDPIAKIFNIDGTILFAILLSFPANEIIIPIILMSYLNGTSLMEYESIKELKEIFVNNGWTIKTAISTLILIMFHFPCSNTLISIKKETNSIKWTIISFILPFIIGLLLCLIISII